METPALLAQAIEDSADIFGISGGGVWTPQTPPLGTPLFRRDEYTTICQLEILYHEVISTVRF